MKEERVEPVSIWKDVSELPDAELFGAENLVLVKADSGHKILTEWKDIMPSRTVFKKFCRINDLLNEHEQMKKDIEELKGKDSEEETRKQEFFKRQLELMDKREEELKRK